MIHEKTVQVLNSWKQTTICGHKKDINGYTCLSRYFTLINDPTNSDLDIAFVRCVVCNEISKIPLRFAGGIHRELVIEDAEIAWIEV